MDANLLLVIAYFASFSALIVGFLLYQRGWLFRSSSPVDASSTAAAVDPQQRRRGRGAGRERMRQQQQRAAGAAADDADEMGEDDNEEAPPIDRREERRQQRRAQVHHQLAPASSLTPLYSTARGRGEAAGEEGREAEQVRGEAAGETGGARAKGEARTRGEAEEEGGGDEAGGEGVCRVEGAHMRGGMDGIRVRTYVGAGALSPCRCRRCRTLEVAAIQRLTMDSCNRSFKPYRGARSSHSRISLPSSRCQTRKLSSNASTLSK